MAPRSFRTLFLKLAVVVVCLLVGKALLLATTQAHEVQPEIYREVVCRSSLGKLSCILPPSSLYQQFDPLVPGESTYFVLRVANTTDVPITVSGSISAIRSDLPASILPQFLFNSAHKSSLKIPPLSTSSAQVRVYLPRTAQQAAEHSLQEFSVALSIESNGELQVLALDDQRTSEVLGAQSAPWPSRLLELIIGGMTVILLLLIALLALKLKRSTPIVGAAKL